MLFGYARVSTQAQNMALQLEALKAAGVDKKHIRQETISGTVSHKDRPVLKKLLARLKPCDILVIWKLNRLGRSVIDLMRISEMFRQRKVHRQVECLFLASCSRHKGQETSSKPTEMANR